MQITTTLITPVSRVRPATFVALGVCVAALLAALALAVVAVAAATTRPFSPGAGDGLVPEGAAVSVTDEHLPAISRLEPALLQALQDAAVAASADGVELDVTSGWRSVAYQEWLLRSAIETYGDAETAREYVAAPEDSAHVDGDGVDIGSLDAQVWLRSEGTTWGLCQTYENEPWHFERATTPGGVCPPMLPDAAAKRGDA